MGRPLDDTVPCTTTMPDADCVQAAFDKRYPSFATVFGEDMATSARMIWAAAWQAHAAEAERDGLDVTITANREGACVAVSLCDDEGRIHKLLWEAPVPVPAERQQARAEQLAYDTPLPCTVFLPPSTRIHKGAYVGALLGALQLRAKQDQRWQVPAEDSRYVGLRDYFAPESGELLVPYTLVLDAIAAVQFGTEEPLVDVTCQRIREKLANLLDTVED